MTPSRETIDLVIDAAVAIESLLYVDMADKRSDPKAVLERLQVWIAQHAMDDQPPEAPI